MNNTLSFDPVDPVVYPYIDVVKDYLEAGAIADINNYEYHVEKPCKAVTISWTVQEKVNKYKLEIATKADYSDAKKITLEGNASSYDLTNLLRDTQYYIRLSVPGKSYLKAETTFKTAYLGPRFLDVGGLYHNCRDLGGYKTDSGTLLYNMIIRGSCPDNCSDKDSITFTDEGYSFLTEEIGIKTQLDLRGTGENCDRTESSFTSASNYVHVPVGAYGSCFLASQAELYKEAFQVFADINNYPIYIHCVGGADRTGTVCILLLAYLGVDPDEIVQDYVVTSFSPVCYQQNARSRENAMSVLSGLNNYAGETTEEKCRNFLISIGLTQQELYNIKAIMTGGNPADYVPTADHGISSVKRFYSCETGGDFAITLNDNIKVSTVLLDEQEASFVQSEKQVTVSEDTMKSLEEGIHSLKIVFYDGESVTISFAVDFVDITGELKVTRTVVKGEQTVVYVEAESSIFTGVEWHFHTRNTTTFTDVEPYILINGQSVTDINKEDMSSYEWTMSPGKTDSRHRVPVDIYADGSEMKLVFRTEWLQQYLGDQELEITFKQGLNYVLDEGTYKLLSDVSYRFTGGSWVKLK